MLARFSQNSGSNSKRSKSFPKLNFVKGALINVVASKMHVLPTDVVYASNLIKQIFKTNFF